MISSCTVESVILPVGVAMARYRKCVWCTRTCRRQVVKVAPKVLFIIHYLHVRNSKNVSRAWRIISCMYNNLCAVVKSGFSISAPFPVLRGILSPLSHLFPNCREQTSHGAQRKNKAGISICNLYLGGAARADDVRTIATSTQATEAK